MALLTVAGGFVVAGAANAAGTLAGSAVTNIATVNYEVGGAAQQPIGSAPGGNTFGAGVDTVFIVDRKLDVQVVADLAQVNIPAGYLNNNPTHPSLDATGTSHALVFTVTNLSNSIQDIGILAIENIQDEEDNDVADTVVATTFTYYVESGDNVGFDALDTPAKVDGGIVYLDAQLPDTDQIVYVVAAIEGPATALPGEFANVTLAAQIRESGASIGDNAIDFTGPEPVAVTNVPDNAVGAVAVATTGADVHSDAAPLNNAARDQAINTILVDSVDQAAGFEEVGYTVRPVATKNGVGANETIDYRLDSTVLPSVGNVRDQIGDGQHSDTATYIIIGNTINVSKASLVVSDPFNGTNSPIRIPGAVVRYTITVQNQSGAVASNVIVTDEIPTNTTYVLDSVVITDNGVTVANTGDGDGSVTYTAPVSPAAGKLDINVPPVEAGTSNVVTFEVTID